VIDRQYTVIVIDRQYTVIVIDRQYTVIVIDRITKHPSRPHNVILMQNNNIV